MFVTYLHNLTSIAKGKLTTWNTANMKPVYSFIPNATTKKRESQANLFLTASLDNTPTNLSTSTPFSSITVVGTDCTPY